VLFDKYHMGAGERLYTPGKVEEIVCMTVRVPVLNL